MEIITDSWQAIADSFTSNWDQLAEFAPRIVGAVLVAVLGWLVAWLIVYVVDQILRSIRLQKLFDGIKLEAVIKKWGSNHDTTGLIVEAVRWFLYLVVFLASVAVLELPNVAAFERSILGYGAQAVAAASIVLVGFILATFLGQVVSGAIKAADLEYGGLAGTLTRTAIQVATLIVALRQVGLTEAQLNVGYTGLVAFLAIAAGLAFGLGSQRVATKWLDDFWKKLSD